jgi:hypothetical protein
MSDDYDFDDTACPKCGQCPTHSRHCDVIGCDDGWINQHDYDDPINFGVNDVERCDACNGTGIQRWCPKCGYDLQCGEYINGKPEVSEE